MGNIQGTCSSCCIRPSEDSKQEEIDLEAQAEDILDEDISGFTVAPPPQTVTLRDDEIQKIVDVWNRKQKEREERDDSVLNPEHQFSIALLMNDESLAKRLLHHISDEEILSKLYHDPLCKPEVRHVIIERAREIAAKRYGLSNSFVGHRVSSKNGKYNIQSVIVGFSAWTSNVKIKDVMGIAVEIRNYRYVDDEAERVEKVRRKAKDELTDPESEVLRSCIRKYSTRLWRRHSNLNMISACSIKSKNNGKEMKRQPCIVLYCSVKGVIPYLEKPFPKLLHSMDGQDVPVDVREGFFQFAGSTVENESEGRTSAFTETPMQKTFPVYTSESFRTRALNREGTIGPFVELSEGKTGFITCAHSVFDCSRQTEFSFPQDNVLPNDVSISIKLEENDRLEDRDIQCKVVEAVFTTRSEDKSKREPSLDAAIVELPDSLLPECEMKLLNNSQIVQCGYDDADFVEFRTGELVKRMTDNFRKFEVLKCGAKTGLTIGAFKLNGIQLKHSDFRFTSNGKPWTFDSHYQIMQGQYEISSRSDDTFIGPGDSGASVYVKGRFGELYCIGIAIGYTSYGSAIVTPIIPILRKFGLNQRYLKKFPEESTEEDSDEDDKSEITNGSKSRSSSVTNKSNRSSRSKKSTKKAGSTRSKSDSTVIRSKPPLPKDRSKSPGTRSRSTPERSSTRGKSATGTKASLRPKSRDTISRPKTSPANALRTPSDGIKVKITHKKTTKPTEKKLQSNSTDNSKSAWNNTSGKSSPSEKKEIEATEGKISIAGSADGKSFDAKSVTHEIEQTKVDSKAEDQTSMIKTISNEILDTHTESQGDVSDRSNSKNQKDASPTDNVERKSEHIPKTASGNSINFRPSSTQPDTQSKEIEEPPRTDSATSKQSSLAKSSIAKSSIRKQTSQESISRGRTPEDKGGGKSSKRGSRSEASTKDVQIESVSKHSNTSLQSQKSKSRVQFDDQVAPADVRNASNGQN